MAKSPAVAEDKFPALDGVRGLAALGVALWHWCAFARIRHPLYEDVITALSRESEFAVTTFFVLSGLVLSLSVIRSSHKLSPPHLLFRYFVDRVFRIAPLLIFTVSLAFAGMYLLRRTLGITGEWASYSVFTLELYLKNLLLLDTHGFNPPGWTLIYEIAAYLILPFLVLSVVCRGLYRVLMLSGLCATSVMIACFWLPPGAFTRIMPMFIPGIVLAVAIKYVPKIPSWFYFGLGILTITAVVLFEPRQYDYALVSAIGCALLIVAAMTSIGMTNTVLTSPPLRWLGNISYSVYLLHYPIFWGLYYALGGFVGTPRPRIWGMVGLVGFPLILALATLTYLFIETPFIKVGKSIGRRKLAILSTRTLPT